MVRSKFSSTRRVIQERVGEIVDFMVEDTGIPKEKIKPNSRLEDVLGGELEVIYFELKVQERFPQGSSGSYLGHMPQARDLIDLAIYSLFPDWFRDKKDPLAHRQPDYRDN